MTTRLLSTLGLLGLFGASGCAGVNPIEPCNPTSELVDPEFVSIGNFDLMVASLRYTGCEEFNFQLCGVGANWLRQDVAELAISHEGDTSCDQEFLEDQTLNLQPLRREYEKTFKVDEAELVLDFGDIQVDYRFAPE
jgi:hypothetical protein